MKQLLIDFVIKVNIETPFIPDRFDLEQYIDKLLQHAVILPIIEQNQLKGFIAFYCNDTVNKKSYFSAIALSPDLRAKRMGSLLMEMAINYVRRNDFERIECQVYKNNTPSFKMCEKMGFSIKEDKGDSYILMKLLK